MAAILDDPPEMDVHTLNDIRGVESLASLRDVGEERDYLFPLPYHRQNWEFLVLLVFSKGI